MATARKPKETGSKTELPLPERHVSMSNALARASHDLNLAEKRVVACGLASTDSKSPHSFNQAMVNGGWIVRLTALEYAAFAGIDPNTAYEQLGDVAKTLAKKHWTIRDGKKISRYPWLSRSTYHEGEGWLELEFTHHTAPHLLALRKGFTSYRLKRASGLRSAYSWRLLECLESWKSVGTWRPTVEDFCHAMDAKPSHRSNFGMLRRSVIEPSVAELRRSDNLIIDWEAIKAGRKVTSLVFKFRPNPQAQLPLG